MYMSVNEEEKPICCHEGNVSDRAFVLIDDCTLARIKNLCRPLMKVRLYTLLSILIAAWGCSERSGRHEARMAGLDEQGASLLPLAVMVMGKIGVNCERSGERQIFLQVFRRCPEPS